MSAEAVAKADGEVGPAEPPGRLALPLNTHKLCFGRLGGLVLLVLSGRSVIAQGDLYLGARTPADSAGLEAGAKGMAARCRAYGIAGAEGEVVTAAQAKYIRLTAPAGFDAAQRASVAKLASMAARQFDLRMLTDKIREEGLAKAPKKGDLLDRAPAPKGTRWYPQLAAVPDALDRYEEVLQDPYLVQDAPLISGSAITKMKWEGAPVPMTYELKAGAAKSFTDRATPGQSYTYPLVVDGYVLHGAAWEFDPYGSQPLSVECPFCKGTGAEQSAKAAPGAGGPAGEKKTTCKKCKGIGRIDLNPGKNRPWVRLKVGRSEPLDAMLPYPIPHPLRVLTDNEAQEVARGVSAPAAQGAGAQGTAAAPTAGGALPAGPASPAPPASSTPDRECARWLLLGKNYFNVRQFDKAEENLNKVLDKCPDGKPAEEAKELLKKIEALK